MLALDVSPKKSQAAQKSTHLSKDNIEARMLVTLINVRSLFDHGCYDDCFELLQYEYLSNSKYTGLLYLYGKYIVKACAKTEDEGDPNSGKQMKFIGSGIGALEECLKSSIPEYHSRINYYIGFAFNNSNSTLKMPLKAVYFWGEAKKLTFVLPY